MNEKGEEEVVATVVFWTCYLSKWYSRAKLTFAAQHSHYHPKNSLAFHGLLRQSRFLVHCTLLRRR